MKDFHDRYLKGVGDLLQTIEQADADYLSVLTLQGRLAQAISETRQYGPTDSARAEIARVTTELDRLCLKHLDQSFRSLCGIDELPETALPKIYHNLPQPDYGRFVGREQELTRIYELLSPTNRHFLVTIDGIGGIGKSALALEVAHRYLRDTTTLPEPERFDAIIWTSAKRTTLTAKGIVQRRQASRTLDDIYTTISITLEREDITRARLEEQPELVRRALTQQRTLLIVDNLETVDDEAVLTFLRELPAPTKAIVTTRHRIDAAHPVRLVGMPWDDAEVLIAQECDKKGMILADEQVRKLYNRTGGVPLALVWIIAQMGLGYSVEAMLHRLSQRSEDISRFCFEGAIERIRNTDAYKLLMALCLFATDASHEAVGYVSGLGEDALNEGLVMLKQMSLVDDVSGRVQMLPLTKLFTAFELERNKNFHWSAKQKRLEWALDIIAKYAGTHIEEGARYIEADYANIVEVIESCIQEGSTELAAKLTCQIAPLPYIRGEWTEAISLIQRALPDTETPCDPAIRADLLRQMGWILTNQGATGEGSRLLHESARLARNIDNLQILSDVHIRLGQAHMQEGEFGPANDFFLQALRLDQEMKDEKGIAACYSYLAEVARLSGDLDASEEYTEKAIKKAQEIGWIRSEAYNQLCLAQIEIAREPTQLKKAQELCQVALDVGRAWKDKRLMAHAMTLNARLEYLDGKLESASVSIQSALHLYSRLSLQRNEMYIQEAHKLQEQIQRALRRKLYE